MNALLRWLQIKREEATTTLVAFLLHFSLLSSYYILRPIRDEMGILAGVANLQWLFTATFIGMLLVVPLFGWITTHYPRRRFLPGVYAVVAVFLFGFYFAIKFTLAPTLVARCFFVFVSIYNLFVISVFWSFMTDSHHSHDSKRLFPIIAAGGTMGAIIGPATTTVLIKLIGVHNLILISISLLLLAIMSVLWLLHHYPDAAANNQARLQGSVWDGITAVIKSRYLQGFMLLMFLYATTSTFLYFQQAWILKATITDSVTRTMLFSGMDLTVNTLTLASQFFITARFIQRFGMAITLSIIPITVTIGFIGLSIVPALVTIVMVQVCRRAGNYAIMRPARESLYTILPREQKYKAKNFLDTTVYRSGDAISAWVYTGFTALGASLSMIALVGVVLSSLWASVAYYLGTRYQQTEQDTIKET